MFAISDNMIPLYDDARPAPPRAVPCHFSIGGVIFTMYGLSIGSFRFVDVVIIVSFRLVSFHFVDVGIQNTTLQ